MNTQTKQSILVIDDTSANIQVMHSILGDQYRILFATNGIDGLKIAEEQMPDLILLDIMMPEIDGFGVIKKLKNNNITRDIPVIFVTAMDDATDETYGLELGAVDYITKPVIPAIVKARVKNHLELKRYRDFLKRLTTLDGLTGIANRRHFDETLVRAWNASLQSQKPISLLLIDIDYFKQFNDHYGHLQGDDCLRQVAGMLEQCLSKSTSNGLLARYGGEEFVILLPDTDITTANAIAQQCQQAIQQACIAHAASEITDYLTLSIGLSSMQAIQGQSADILIKQADACLYEAKAAGRNQVISSAA